MGTLNIVASVAEWSRRAAAHVPVAQSYGVGSCLSALVLEQIEYTQAGTGASDFSHAGAGLCVVQVSKST